jgi:hypothetical protein
MLEGIRELTKQEVSETCQELGTVQERTNKAVLKAGPRGGRSPSVYGTAVHYQLKGLIEK